MKTSIVMILSLLVFGFGCDQPKSGPVEPTAKPATTTPPKAGASSDLYMLSGPSAPVKVGELADVTMSVKPGAGLKINKRFDWNFEFHPNDAVEIAAPSVGGDAVQLGDKEATIPVKLTAKQPGEHQVKATANFSVCNDEKCELIRQKEIAFTVSATDG